MPDRPVIVAIDGPAGGGKSTVAKALATELGATHLDTGAMYRAVTWAVLRDGHDTDDAPAATTVAVAMELEVEPNNVRVDGVDVTAAIRAPEVDAAVSAVSAHPGVRSDLRRRQREWVVGHELVVVEGRDIGTVVFPDADLKVYLTASPAVRAQRRADQTDAGSDLDAVAEAIARRDRLDSERADSPLAAAADAIVLDTSDSSVGEVVDQVRRMLVDE